MNSFKNEAKKLLNENKKQIYSVMIFISLIQILPVIFLDSILGILLAIAVMTSGYGFIMTSKKVLLHRGHEVEVSNEGMIGIKKFTKLAGTYLLYDFDLFLTVFLELVTGIIVLVVCFFNQLSVLYYMDDTQITYEFLLDLLYKNPGMIALLVVLGIVITISVVRYYLTYGASKYLIENKITGFDALAQSKDTMKGHRLDLLKLELSYLPSFALTIILGILVEAITELVIPSNYGLYVVLPLVVEAIISVVIYRASNQIALYNFYHTLIPMASLEEERVGVESNIQQTQDQDWVNEGEYMSEPVLKQEDVAEFEKISKIKLTLGLFIFIPFYLFFGSYIVSLIFISIPYFANMSDMNVLNSWYNMFYDGLLALMGIAFFYEFFKGYFRKFFAVIKREGFFMIVKNYLIIYGVNILCAIIVSLLLSSGGESANQEAIETILNVEPLPIVLATVFFAPILEEIAFRGIIFRFFYQYNRYLGHIASALLFGFVHCMEAIIVYGQYSEIIQMIPYVAMGLVLSIFYEKYKTLSVPIFFHGLHNCIQVILMLFM